jgi:anti-sigma regulatory factor (Ser/Thr protein kinase)
MTDCRHIPGLGRARGGSRISCFAQARAAVTAWLVHQPHHRALLEDALLLVSELVTNCVRHARITTDDPLRLTGSRDTTTLRLEVRDNGTGGTVARRTPKRDGAVGGFALDLVARLSSAWGSDRDAHGTTVRLELPIPADVIT